jgi:hypothetical protein
MTNTVSLLEIIDFMEKRCVGVDQSADAMRWRIIHAARASEPRAERLPEIDVKRFEQAPCYLCGYNGTEYFAPETHSCAGAYHRVVRARNT